MLKIYRAVRPNVLTQGWAENLACTKTDANGKAIRPFKIRTARSDGSCNAGYTKFYPAIGMKGHNGYDLALPHGEPIYHSGDYNGWMKTEVDSSGGIGVDIVSNEEILRDNTSEASHIKLRYWHLKSVVGWDGKKISPGDLIGYGDNTGASSGNHLHFGLKWCNKEGKGTHTNNGYYGALDLTEFYENKFVVDVFKEIVDYGMSVVLRARTAIFYVRLFLKNYKR